MENLLDGKEADSIENEISSKKLQLVASYRDDSPRKMSHILKKRSKHLIPHVVLSMGKLGLLI